MKAIVFREGSQWAVEDQPTPEVGPGDVLLKIIQTGVCGTDEHLLHGGFIAKFPLIPGHEMLAEVAELGAGVTRLAVGDRVVLDNTIHCGECGPCLRGEPLFCEQFTSLGCNAAGGFAEYVSVRAAKCIVVNDVDPDAAVFVEPTACAMHGADVLALKPASDVLIFGAGPTGLILAQLLRMAGAARVTMAAPTQAKLDLAESLGVDRTVLIDRKDPTVGEAELAEIAPEGFDAVVEATGSLAVFERSIRLTRTGGTVLVYGLAPEDGIANVKPYEIFSRELTIKGSFAQAHCFPRAALAIASGRVRTEGMITERIGFEDFGKAFEHLHDSRVVKTVFAPTSGAEEQ